MLFVYPLEEMDKYNLGCERFSYKIYKPFTNLILGRPLVSRGAKK